MFIGKATLTYYDDWVVAYINPDISAYYYSLIPPYYYPNRQMYPPHLTVVRINPIEVVEDRKNWGKYDGEVVEFEYEGIVRYKSPYFFIKCWSERIGEVREELGLPKIRADYDCYHVTIGNTK